MVRRPSPSSTWTTSAGSAIHSIRGRANEIVLAVKFVPNVLTSQWVLFINRKLKFNWCVCPWLTTPRQHWNLSRPRNGTIDASGLHFLSSIYFSGKKRRRIKSTNSQLQGDMAATLQDRAVRFSLSPAQGNASFTGLTDGALPEVWSRSGVTLWYTSHTGALTGPTTRGAEAPREADAGK